ncbi:conserved hypothetical protein [Yersinia pestis KIM D27]|uniref:Uncharacterized protein n=1 Tax=Yersinia pestis biovar Orientalis str. IP275 TaxID=373665 RepID=A0AAV3BB06_YERPE|nr:hypothetical protein YpAngola_A2047 [Yersinia pestis Angola]EDR31910.1 hypothetical protein YPIP275_2243 [Yersinia pestis biovar Orientalis str. IP275]EDR42539.1 hypothetical protein YpE1979001_4391 [Yersinia pestis biovar Antiqua str. E1979001]EDR57828.1 hypothetical protein YpMG051020_3587 [Yersinia pestis biovar Orientalis str. MG05-1020]EDR64974.1 hypothetical protein YpK1973002_4190 [Yersinia pestis biovar Mediaevalis str. K1973002]EFA45866.1 conserved hypothetical protein [Yersinia pe
MNLFHYQYIIFLSICYEKWNFVFVMDYWLNISDQCDDTVI